MNTSKTSCSKAEEGDQGGQGGQVKGPLLFLTGKDHAAKAEQETQVDCGGLHDGVILSHQFLLVIQIQYE